MPTSVKLPPLDRSLSHLEPQTTLRQPTETREKTIHATTPLAIIPPNRAIRIIDEDQDEIPQRILGLVSSRRLLHPTFPRDDPEPLLPYPATANAITIKLLRRFNFHLMHRNILRGLYKNYGVIRHLEDFPMDVQYQPRHTDTDDEDRTSWPTFTYTSQTFLNLRPTKRPRFQHTKASSQRLEIGASIVEGRHQQNKSTVPHFVPHAGHSRRLVRHSSQRSGLSLPETRTVSRSYSPAVTVRSDTGRLLRRRAPHRPS